MVCYSWRFQIRSFHPRGFSSLEIPADHPYRAQSLMQSNKISKILEQHQQALRESEECKQAGNPEIRLVFDPTPPWALYPSLTHSRPSPTQPRDTSIATAIFSGQGKPFVPIHFIFKPGTD